MSSQVRMDQIPWQEGQEEDFKDLHKAIRNGKTLKQTDSTSDSSSEEDDQDPGLQAHPGERLLWAAQHNQLKLVDQLIRQESDGSGGGISCSNPNLVNYKDSDGYTALHRAAYSNHPQMVRKLIQYGADIQAETTEDSWKPLHSACRWNAAPCVDILLSYGADVNALTQGNQTPLHLAAFCGNSRDTLQLLLMHPDLKPKSFNCQQDTPRDIALRNGNCVELFDLIERHYRVFS